MPIPAAQLGIAGALLLILGHALMKTGAFIGTAQVASNGGKESENEPDDISNYAGLVSRAPITAFCMLIFMFALAGIPPTAGYIGKFVLFSSAIYSGLVWLAVLAILNSALSLVYYLRIISYMYLKEPTGPKIAEQKGYVVALVLTLIGSGLDRRLPGRLHQLGTAGSSGSAASVNIFAKIIFYIIC